MNNQFRILDPETKKRAVEKLREVCRMYNEFNMLLDEAIAQVKADIRNSTLGKAKRLVVEKGAKYVN